MKLRSAPGIGSLPIIRAPGRVLTRVVGDQHIVAKWPRGWKQNTYCQEFNRAQFALVAFWGANPEPMQLESALNFSIGSNDTWKDILMRAAYGTLYRVTMPDGTVLDPAAHSCNLDPEPAEGNVPWKEIARWDAAIDPAIAALAVTGLSAYNELLIQLQATTLTAAGFRQVVLSDDDGASYYETLGNYTATNSGFSGGAQSAIFGTLSTSAAAAWCEIWIPNINIDLIQKAGRPLGMSTWMYWLTASQAPITAIKVKNSGAGNYNGGKIIVFAR